MDSPDKHIIVNREISWLSFSERILQEARDPRNPLFDRIKFLAIYSSNLDEYFRVRVASLRSLLHLKKKSMKKLNIDPEDLLREIQSIVLDQQDQLGNILTKHILPELRANGIFLVTDGELSPGARRCAREYFAERVAPLVSPVFLGENKEAPFLHNRAIYLAVGLLPHRTAPAGEPGAGGADPQYAILEIPTPALPRFFAVPEEGGTTILFLDDVVRLGLPEIFPNHDVVSAFSIKMTRDADLRIEDEFAGNFLEKVKQGLKERLKGNPCRFLYDAAMPKEFLKTMREVFSLSREDLVSGGRYHNFSDLMDLPNPHDPALREPPVAPLCVSDLDHHHSMFEAIRSRDIILHYPYQSYDYLLRLLREAASDPTVTSVRITLYRVARTSRVIEALLALAARGKSVTAFVELKARFDEESNLHWAEELEKGGARVLYSFPGLKVHAKLCLITSEVADRKIRYAYLSTGNFNERTAAVYSDMGFFTADERITVDVENIFEFLGRNTKNPQCEHLLVAPFNMRESFLGLLDREIKHARHGEPAYAILKMNSLEDPEIIEKLYEASIEGVKIYLIVRGICCLLPGMKKVSENISAISIVDRYLEHSRVYLFHNGGDERCYLASADWMVRNFSRRVEVAFPIYNVELRNEIRGILDLQLRDNVKARIISVDQNNKYKKAGPGESVRAQAAAYEYLKRLCPARPST